MDNGLQQTRVVSDDGTPRLMFHGSVAANHSFAENKASWFIADRTEAEEYGPHVTPAYLAVRNPYISSHRENTVLGPQRLIDKARRRGHDGILLPRDEAFYDEHIYTEALFDVWIVMEPGQIHPVAP